MEGPHLWVPLSPGGLPPVGGAYWQAPGWRWVSVQVQGLESKLEPGLKMMGLGVGQRPFGPGWLGLAWVALGWLKAWLAWVACNLAS